MPRPTEEVVSAPVMPCRAKFRDIYAYVIQLKNMAGSKQVAQKEKRSNRGIVWPDTATIELLDIWQEEEIRLAFENTKSSKDTRATYQVVKVSKKIKRKL